MRIWSGRRSARLFTESSKTENSPVRGGKAEERSRWYWKGTVHNDLENQKIRTVEFGSFVGFAVRRRFTSGKITNHGAWLYD
jgi:hypothetical protein